MGGIDSSDNLVKLTAKEHFIIHKLLTEIYPTNNRLHYAAFLMCKMKNAMGRDYRVSAREYQRLKENIVLDDEHKRNISIGVKKNPNIKYWKGKTLSDSHKKHISKGMCGKVRSDSHRKNSSKSIIQLDLCGNIVNEYSSLKEAGTVNGVYPANISAVLRGKSSHCGGFLWKYKKNQ
jgi:hypothetical protein